MSKVKVDDREFIREWKIAVEQPFGTGLDYMQGKFAMTKEEISGHASVLRRKIKAATGKVLPVMPGKGNRSKLTEEQIQELADLL